MSDRVPYVIPLPPELVRDAHTFIGDGAPYNSLAELVVAAIENQLALTRHVHSGEQSFDLGVAMHSPPQTTPGAKHTHLPDSPASGDPVLRPIEGGEVVTVEAKGHEGPLPFLTNRLNPFVLVTRIAANLSRTGEADYPNVASVLSDRARTLGLRLKAQDAEERRRGPTRRSVSWPVGADAEKSTERFLASYAIDGSGGGPLRVLGLAQVSERQVVLTDRGLALARSSCPLLGEGRQHERSTLSQDAQEVLEHALLDLPAEVEQMNTFFDALGTTNTQRAIDEALYGSRPHWSDALVASQRAALIGRFRDLELIALDGRGPEAKVALTQSGQAFAQRVADARNEQK